MDRDKLKKLVIIVGAVLVVVVIIIVIFSMLGTTKKMTYKEVEDEIKNVAEEYYKENSSLLPKEGDIREISVDDLVKLELMKPLSELLENGTKCTGKATVKNENGKYFYIPYIECGDEYVTSELYKKVIDDNEVVEAGSGLYLQGDNYVFRGENLNNYLKLSDKLWRIVSIDNEGNMELVLNDELDSSTVWDDRYNSESEYTSGINDYTVSRIRDELNSIYNSNDLLDENAKELVIPKNFCISGKTIEDDIDNIDCEKYIENANIGLLNVYQYTNASVDTNCNKIGDRECQNYNYLKPDADSNGWWTLTPNSENTYEVFYIESYGTVDVKRCSTNSKLKPVIHLTKDLMYDSGKGTEKDPYIVK